MNYRIITYVIGWVLNLEAVCMTLPALTGLIYGETAWTSFLIAGLISALVEPTAASAWAPEKRPTTTISAALKSSCSTPESIRGKVKTRIFPNSGPLHISISYDFFKTHSSGFQISRMQTM